MGIKYNQIQDIAYEILKKHGGNIPIDLFSIIDTVHNLSISTYDDYAYILGITQDELIERFKSDEGFLFCFSLESKNREYLLCYNQNKTEERIRWTIGHELGHFYLDHNYKTNRNLLNRYTLSKEATEIFEQEANHFAKHFLAPFPLVLALKGRLAGFSKNSISKVFKINYEPAGYINTNISRLGRISFLYEDAVLVRRFGASLTKIVNENYCISCKSIFYGKNLNYCPICGKDNFLVAEKNKYDMYLNFRGGNKMNHTKIALDKYHKALECPVCKNTDTPAGDFCQICGSYLINKCSNEELDCNKLLQGDARFCTYCGAQSTFYIKGYLKPHTDSHAGHEFEPLDEDDVPF